MIIVPAIDIRGGRCVRLVQGDYDRELGYDADPVDVARAWGAQGARLVHLVDLDAARAGSSRNWPLLQRVVAAAGVPVEVGGGVRSAEAVADLLGAGVRHAILGTLAAEQPELLAGLVARFGDGIVLGLDARDGVVAVRGWESSSGVDAIDLARRAAAAGVRRAVYTNVACDGTLEGPDVEGGAAIQRETGLLVTLSGGVGTLDHLRAAAAAGLDACIVGRALHDGRFSLAEARLAAGEPGA